MPSMHKKSAARLCFMPWLMFPDEVHENINSISIQGLKKKGIKAVIFDAEGTLIPYNGHDIHPSIRRKMIQIRRNFKCCILSNRSMNECTKLNMRIIHAPREKPHPLSFRAAMKNLGSMPSKTAVIGDSIITDIAGGNSASMYTILVRPVALESCPLSLKILKLIENAFVAIIK